MSISKENIRHKTRSRRATMRRVRSSKVQSEGEALSPEMMDQESNLETSDALGLDGGESDLMNSFCIIHSKSLITMMKQTLCITCHNPWDGNLSMKKRDGLYVHLVFTCVHCGNNTDLDSSPVLKETKRREINVRLVIGGVLSGIGYQGVMKLLGAMNLPSPVYERYYSKTLEFVMDFISNAQGDSMMKAVRAAVLKNDGDTNLTVSGDGAWVTRGYSSTHGIAALCSTTRPTKVLDIDSLSKRCSKCHGAKSFCHEDPELFEMYKQIHNCELNYEGKFVLIINRK